MSFDPEAIASVGALVRALVASDAAHARRGRVEHLPDVAPVALVRWHCGCRTYVPLHRLMIDPLPALPRCEVTGCIHPRWKGPYCSTHGARPALLPARRTGESFEPDSAAGMESPLPYAQSGGPRDIDDLGTRRALGAGT